MIHTLGHSWLKRNIILHAFFIQTEIITIIIIYATPDGHAHERKQVFVTAEDF